MTLADGKTEELAVPAKYDVWDVAADGRLAMHWDTHAHWTGSQLFLSAADGSALRSLARRREQYYWYPRFSPDGKKVLAKHLDARGELGGGVSIRVLAVDGSSELAIDVSPDHGAEIACWSPDGAHIAVAAFENAAFEGGAKVGGVFLTDAGGQRVRRLTLRGVELITAGDVEWTR
ncbi:MAG: hypothetical protein GY711_14555 [bacterium]|nr:hypothetical protein [bacterium]